MKLTLPAFDIQSKDGKVFCLVRKKWIVLTPEEWVRQHIIHLMIDHLNYPRGMMKLEHSIKYFKKMKRSDVMVLSKDSGIFMLLECKAASVKIDAKAIQQIATYNKILNARFVSVSNGIHHFVWERMAQGYNQINEFPSYS